MKVLYFNPEVTTVEKAQETLVEYFKQIRAAIIENSLCVDFYDPFHINESAIMKVR
jgi:hypothetical protein